MELPCVPPGDFDFHGLDRGVFILRQEGIGAGSAARCERGVEVLGGPSAVVAGSTKPGDLGVPVLEDDSRSAPASGVRLLEPWTVADSADGLPERAGVVLTAELGVERVDEWMPEPGQRRHLPQVPCDR